MEKLEVVFGESRNRSIAQNLIRSLRDSQIEGTIYFGYPLLASIEESIPVDALLVSAQRGLVAFQFATQNPRTKEEWDACKAEQDKLYSALVSNLGRYESLREGRKFVPTIETVTIFPIPVEPPATITEGHFVGIDEIGAYINRFNGLTERVLRALQAALQRITTIKPPKKRIGARTTGSRGAILKEIEKHIANLDRWQKRAAIETPEGPQRVRGLAGSGKTIVLALKAAYLHAQHPDWLIGVTFQTRSLYQQFEDLITRFSFEHSNDKPNLERLRILHAWGSSDRGGVYTTIARAVGAPSRDFLYGKSTFGAQMAFQGVCRELLDITGSMTCKPIFDVVLIDEAQDLPPEFFQLVYRYTSEPKRIVWAYDELQKLSEAAMPSTKELFGVDRHGNDLVSLASGDGEARRDVILPVCYRNPPWALATAHALGFGVYSAGGLVQHFDTPTLWTEIGYQVVSGELELGKSVTLERAPSSYPEYFPRLLDRSDCIMLSRFQTAEEQDEWVAGQIKTNLATDELELDDILIILPDAYTAQTRSKTIVAALARHGIRAHLAGVNTSRDELFTKESVAIAHIFRAKGNEAPMVYLLDSQNAVQSVNAITRRNAIFTAITRSRAWIRVCGWGLDMEKIAQEVKKVQNCSYHLSFKVPTPSELAKMRKIHRDRTGAELAAIQRAKEGLTEFINAMEREEIDINNLSPAMRTKLARLVRQTSHGGNEEEP